MRVSAKTLLITAALALGPATGCVGLSSSSEDSASHVALPEGISPELVAAAKEKVQLVAREIDKHHVRNYDLGEAPDDATLASQFVDAVVLEYSAEPELLASRLQSLASMVLFSAPQVTTDPALGKVTPFHGMDDQAFEALMNSEDTVFNSHMSSNGGSPNGVRPFSVCETKFLIEIAKGHISDPAYVSNRAVSNYDAYAPAYQAYSQAVDADGAPNCSAADMNEWYDFRGLGHLRPTWLESNISDRFLGRMLGECDGSPSEGMEDDCARWDEDRLGYRDAKNTELTLREVFYDPNPETLIGNQSMESYMRSPNNGGALIEDRNGDGIGEWLAPGTATFTPGARLRIAKGSAIRLPTDLDVTVATAATILVGNEQRSLEAGSALKINAGASIMVTSTRYLPLADGAPFGLNANTRVEVAQSATVTLPDGTSGRVPSQWELGNGSEEQKFEVRLANAASFPLDPDSAPRMSIDKINSGVLASNSFAYELRVTVALAGAGSLNGTINAGDLEPYTQVDPRWNPEYLQSADLGLMSVFSDGTGCTADHPSPEDCDILRRFYALIDRHENFYQTYSSVRPTASNVSQQPSPLVACSITLRASHHWDSAGIPQGGRAGFIYLMRVPFAQILAGDTRSIDTLSRVTGEPGPQVLTVQQLYQHNAALDMSKVWLDIATLSNNQYSSEHEVSKFGSVPAEQIEGILVVRLPAAMDDSGEGLSTGDTGEEG